LVLLSHCATSRCDAEAKEKSAVIKSVIAGCLLLWVFSLPGIGSLSYAENAEVLPKGVSRASIESKFYFPITKRFNPAGDAEDVAVDANTSLNSQVFPGLSQLESFFRLPPGSATFGNSVVSFSYDLVHAEFFYQYGVTDSLTAGVLMPYLWITNHVDARLDPSTATVGKSPRLGRLVPLRATPDAVPLTTDDVQHILGSGLDINGDGAIDVSGFGYRRIETWSDQGLGDIDAGLRYQYLKTDKWRLAVTDGMRFPTGQVDDPDSLVDLALGKGAYGLFFHFNHDYTGIDNLVLNGTFRYLLVLPDRKVRRIPASVNQPVTATKLKVDRDLGDEFEFEGSAVYTLFKGFSVSGLYQYGFKLKDEVSGPEGFSFKALEDETDWTSHIVIAGLSYSTIPLYLEKKFPWPLTATLFYRNRFAGSNNVFKSQYLSLALAVFF
jgi:hypothetical protein